MSAIEKERRAVLALLKRKGATDAVLQHEAFRIPISEETLPDLAEYRRGCRYGLRLDCLLAHLADVHVWPPGRLAEIAGRYLKQEEEITVADLLR